VALTRSANRVVVVKHQDTPALVQLPETLRRGCG
jgi:hypothetical protein